MAALESNAMRPGGRTRPERVLGRAPDELLPAELAALEGKLVALELYTPGTTPLRKIEAIGDSAAECMEQLRARGLDPRRFEYRMLKAPW